MGRDFTKPLQKQVAKEGKLLKEEATYLQSENIYEESKIVVVRTYEYLNREYLVFFDQELRLKYPDRESEELE